MRGWITGVIGVAGVVCGVTAQQPAPLFRAGVDLVHIDVSVFDRQRRPVLGLTAEDFVVFEDGRPQTVATFAAVDVPDAAPPSAAWIRDIAPDTRRNDTLQEQRLFVIVMDDATAQNDLHAITAGRKAATEFVNRLGPGDLAAIVFTLNTPRSQDYTSDRATLLRAVNRFDSGFRDMGRLTAGANSDEFYYQAPMDTIAAVAQSLTALPQRRKTLVYVGQGMPYDPESTSVSQDRFRQRFQRALAAAQQANVNVYTLDTCGLRVPPRVPAADPDTPPNPPPMCIPGLEQRFLWGLAESTGGRAALDQNDLTPAVEQIFAENASYYLLGVRSDNPRREGKSRRLSVKVRGRDDVEVRARSGYVEPSAKREARDAEIEASAPLRKAISGLLPKAGLPLQVWAVPFPVPGTRDARVAITLGVRHPFDARTVPAQEFLDVNVQAFSADGRPRAAHALSARLALRPGPSGDVAFEVQSSVRLPPGRYQLRIGAMVRSSKTSGSIYYDVEVPDFTRAPASLAGLAVHTAPAMVSAVGETPWLPVPMTTERIYERTTRVVVFGRVYQRRREVGPVRWTADVLHSSGRNVSRLSGSLLPERFTNGAADLRIEVPVSNLPPGPYLLRVSLPGIDGPPDLVTRDLRFWVR